MSLYSIVVPVYNSEHTLEELYARLKNVFENTMQEEFELILVDDSSRDNSYAVMEKLHRQDAVSYTHLDVYKRQLLLVISLHTL